MKLHIQLDLVKMYMRLARMSSDMLEVMHCRSYVVMCTLMLEPCTTSACALGLFASSFVSLMPAEHLRMCRAVH